MGSNSREKTRVIICVCVCVFVYIYIYIYTYGNTQIYHSDFRQNGQTDRYLNVQYNLLHLTLVKLSFRKQFNDRK